MWKPKVAAGLALAVSGTAGLATASGPADPAATPHIVALEPVNVPIVDGGRVLGRLELKINLAAADVSGAQAITAAMPTVREDTVATVSEFARLYATPHKAVDTIKLTDALRTALQRGHGDVAQVLILEVAARNG